MLSINANWDGSTQAEEKIVKSGQNKEYLPIEGLDTFRKATVDLLLGSGHPAIKEVGS